MRVLKPVCPVCYSRNTRVRTSRSETDTFQTIYADCLEEECLTRFKAELASVEIIHSLASELAKPKLSANPLNQIQLAF